MPQKNSLYKAALIKPSRLKQLSCLIFGHDWNEKGSSTDTESNIVLEHYEKCSHCKLEIRDRSGYTHRFNKQSTALKVIPFERT